MLRKYRNARVRNRGCGGVYGATKVLGEDLCRIYREITGASVAMLRYHDLVPKPSLANGPRASCPIFKITFVITCL